MLLNNKNKAICKNEVYARRLCSALGIRGALLLALFNKAKDNENADYLIKEIEKIELKKQCIFISDLDINGLDLKNIGIEEGKTMGTILNYLLEIVLENQDLNKKEILLEKAKLKAENLN